MWHFATIIQPQFNLFETDFTAANPTPYFPVTVLYINYFLPRLNVTFYDTAEDIQQCMTQKYFTIKSDINVNNEF